ncbi:hypothetical protein IV203_003009 [Nitzschia inconspicua]|uniref:Uncharacterized protein n=1 Tax=Nitzschia inconspicua TaxID=303405 RepID=A0A9K3PQM7_9STRA|nr:hypothetical protein IV203_003009 [Nitzschia inconspicua]
MPMAADSPSIRHTMHHHTITPAGISCLFFVDSERLGRPNAANAALPFFEEDKDRRQLDLCLVNLLRLQYWAMSVSDKLQRNKEDVEKLKSSYLEARLGCKVIVAQTKKIGGGANANVFMLKGLQVKDCLDDLRFYVDRPFKKAITQYSDDLIETLASIVEFDGLETTQDPSPRSELTLKMFTPQKGVYVQRMLAERIVPLTDDIMRLFGPDTKSRTMTVVQEFYPKEVPESVSKKLQQEASGMTPMTTD